MSQGNAARPGSPEYILGECMVAAALKEGLTADQIAAMLGDARNDLHRAAAAHALWVIDMIERSGTLMCNGLLDGYGCDESHPLWVA